MLERLFSRNMALLVGVILAGQVCAGMLVHRMVIRPQADRIANVTADTVGALSMTMAGLPVTAQDALIERLNAQGRLLLRPLSSPPADGQRFPSFLEISFMQVLAKRLGRDGSLDWITDSSDRLWVRLDLGGRDYWVSLTPPRQRSAMTSLLLAFFVASVVALAVGLVVQGWIDRPLRRLAYAVDRYDGHSGAEAVAIEGPREVQAVAAAFLRMADRLRQQEADRAVMLAGVSHDLRTPLTRLRLSIELMQDADPELLATAVRQTERMEAMLGQFLDFARGFEAEASAPVEVAGLVRNLAADMGWDGQVSLDVQAPLAATVRPKALERAVANLVENALKHGSAPVRLGARRRSGGIEISVTDHGPGIDPGALASLLRPFSQGEAARGKDGTGLGLAIADQAVRALGGALRFDQIGPDFRAVIALPDRGPQG
ncbi:two-component system osmolarity sensor histidine kinase EnvZ [Novosphingobium kunmingense]|uniref:histidine kinase n=2 Tax=Novosphingobium kunmingense TaxID=1211806 RepID=A0A2N0H3S0_9SPHN|nr:two-component system osmolarity sensor histidine kinase EnvZ [Novosphingobium kunmingense]